MSTSLRSFIVSQLLPKVQTPGQYLGGEVNSLRKDPARVRGRLCFASPDTYALGMSHHGLQVLYDVMNRRPDWACERVFSPWTDLERLLREHRLPLFSLETYSPLAEFDVLGFTLQYDLCYTNVLTILDLGGIPLRAEERSLAHPLVIAGGPCVQNSEPMSRFIDLFVVGDGEEALPQVCDEWLRLKASGGARAELLRQMAARLPFAYVPQAYTVRNDGPLGLGHVEPVEAGVPAAIRPAVVEDLDALPLPTSPIVPWVECVQDRIALEIMRGCPWRCRFCQSTTSKRPLRFRRVETIVAAAFEAYRNTGMDEIALLSLSASDYPHFEELVRRMQETFRPLGAGISVPSLRVNEQLRAVTSLLTTERHSGLTLAPEVALDDMRRQIGKPIRNEDLIEGCRAAFQNGFQRVKLYFMCGLPGERPADLDGMIDMAETLSRLGREVSGRPATVVVSVSNFVPKPNTPYQWNAMQTREYFRAAHDHLRGRRRMRSVDVKCHPVEASLLEGVMARGDRRLGEAIELAWRRGARFDGWSDQLQPALWWEALADAGIDTAAILHRPYPADARLPWDHIGIRQGRIYLERQRDRSQALACMAPPD